MEAADTFAGVDSFAATDTSAEVDSFAEVASAEAASVEVAAVLLRILCRMQIRAEAMLRRQHNG